MKDGIATVEFIGNTFSGTTVYGADVQAGAGTIGNAELATSAASGTKVSLEYPVAYTGSPVRGNIATQYGSFTAVSDSGLAVSFGKAFAAAPTVFLTTQSGATAYTAGISAGSFIGIVPTGSATSVGYLAIGSGRI